MIKSIQSIFTNQDAETNAGNKDSYYSVSRVEMLRYIKSGSGRLLDIGCGNGAFGHLVKGRIGSEVWGVELVQDAAERASAVLDRVFIGPIEEIVCTLEAECFDVISFNDVLEHLSDPIAVLTSVKRLLRPNGIVIASIPNIRFYRALKHIVWDGDFHYVDSGTFDRTHLRFFTKKSIVRMFAEAGYDVEQVEGINAMVPDSLGKRFLFRLLRFSHRFADTQFLQFACAAKMST